LAFLLLSSLAAAPLARAQSVAPPPVAIPPPAPPQAVGPEAPPPAPPPAEPAPGYGYGPPPQPYYYYPRYRPMPYAYPPAAPAIESMEGFHAHDGFYMRVHVGISATGFSSTQAGTKTSYSGGGVSSGIALGGAIAHNLILYGAVVSTDTSNPDKQVGGTSVNSDLGEIGVGAIGPGLAYYFDRINLYLSGTFGLAGFTADGSGGFRVDSSKSGAAFELMVGKEWWVSRDWGLGIAGELFGASLKDKNTAGLSWSASAASVLLSATYN
jgi:hypothetical protein